MLTAFRVPIAHGHDQLLRPPTRYDLLRRLSESAARRQVTVLAFGLADEELRVLLEGPAEVVDLVILGTKSGTCRVVRGQGGVLIWNDTERIPVTEADLAATIAWCHTAPQVNEPLSSPWSSHRDLLGYRHAPFYDAAPALARVDPAEVHRLAGGGPLPRSPRSLVEAGLEQLLRVAAAVHGVPTSSRTCNRLFVQLARAQGWRSGPLEHALQLTDRRIRQLARGEDPLLPIAQAHLADSRLCQVP